MLCFSLFRSCIQPVTPWCPNPSPRWSLLRRRRRRTGQSTGRREQRTSSPTQTKPHLQARSRGQQRTSPPRWTSTNCYSCRPLSFTSVCPATRPDSVVLLRVTAQSPLSPRQTAAFLMSTAHQSASPACHFSFSLMNTKILRHINSEWTTLLPSSCGMEPAFSMLLWWPLCLKIVLFRMNVRFEEL